MPEVYEKGRTWIYNQTKFTSRPMCGIRIASSRIQLRNNSVSTLPETMRLPEILPKYSEYALTYKAVGSRMSPNSPFKIILPYPSRQYITLLVDRIPSKSRIGHRYCRMREFHSPHSGCAVVICNELWRPYNAMRKRSSFEPSLRYELSCPRTVQLVSVI